MVDPIQIRSPQAIINRARYAGKDFFTVVDDVIARIKTSFGSEYDEFISSSTGQMLIDIFAWTSETISFYIDRQASESYLATARTRTAVSNIVRMWGYKPYRAVSASVDLSVVLSSVQLFDVTIPAGFAFQGPNGLQFESLQDVTFPAGEGPTSLARTVSVGEGKTRVETFVADGTKRQTFQLHPATGKEVLDGVTVVVDSVTWSEVDVLTFVQEDQYEIAYHSQPVLLRFGDGVAGNVPPVGASITVTYKESSGAAGAALSGTIVDVVDPLVVSSTTIPLTITQPSVTAPGADAESITSIKANAPGFFAARNVAVTQEDYIALSQAYADPLAGAVAVAQAFVAHGVGGDLKFLSLVSEAKAIASPVQSDVNAGAASIRTSATDVSTQRTALDASIAIVDSHLANIASNPQTSTVSGEVKSIRDAIQLLRAAVAGIVVDADTGLAAGTLGDKDTQFNAIKTAADAMGTDFDAVTTETSNIESDVAAAGVGTAAMTISTTAIQVDADSISAQSDVIDAAVGTAFVDALSLKLDEISAHVDGFLSADCKANLVQVPILSKDSDGFLVAPANALVRSLETYLRGRKEITHVVEVVSGAPWLVAAEISGKIGVATGAVTSKVLASVRAAIEDVLRDRAFSTLLRLSDLYSAVVPDALTGLGGVVGVTHAILTISGPATYVDTDGNLSINSNQIITRGTITLVQDVIA